MKYFILTIFVLIFLIINSCESDPTSPNQIVPPNGSVYKQIIITQTDYLNFNISDNDSFLISTKSIIKILLGKKTNGIFSSIDSITPLYQISGNNYKLKFNFNQTVDDSILENEFTIRYILYDKSFYDLDTSIASYKYPYGSTEILITWQNLIQPPLIDVQSFDIIGNKIYYHPSGPYGLYEYNLDTKQSVLKIDYSGGDHIAASENYIYLDISHTQIARYNLLLDSIDLMINISTTLDSSIFGMELYENELYVLTNYREILVFNLELQYQRMISLSQFSLWLTISDNIVYSNTNQIIRFNLATNSLMDPIRFPASSCEAIRIIENKMFFTDYNKRIIGYFNLSDIK